MQEENRLKSLLRILLRPEVVLLVLVPLASLAVLGMLGLLTERLFGRHFWDNLEYLKFFGCKFFYWIGLAAAAYLSFSVVAYAIERWRIRRMRTSGPSSAVVAPASRALERFQAARSFAGITLMFVFALMAHFIAMNALCQPSRSTVARADNLLMQADELVFGTYVPFELHEHEFFQKMAKPMVYSYTSLTIVMVSVLVALCMFQYERFRQYSLAILVVMYLALPGWYALPAVSPSEAYRLNIINEKIPFDIAMGTAPAIVHLSPVVSKFLNQVEPNQSSAVQGRFYVTCFPSMHVAWGMLAVWFGALLYARSAWLLVPWGMLNAVGAIFTLQHYAVDVPAGMIVAAVGVLLVHGLVVLEARWGLQPPKGYGIFGSARKDAASLGRWLLPTSERMPGRA